MCTIVPVCYLLSLDITCLTKNKNNNVMIEFSNNNNSRLRVIIIICSMLLLLLEKINCKFGKRSAVETDCSFPHQDSQIMLIHYLNYIINYMFNLKRRNAIDNRLKFLEA